MPKIYEMRWHGRGGQGIVLANQLFARAALREGKYAQAFPEFGPERSGAPVRGFTRISTGRIDIHQQIYQPDVVAVVDPAFLNEPGTFEGLKTGGMLIASIEENLSYEEDFLRKRFGLPTQKIFTVDAVRIAQEVFQVPIYNTTVMGAVAKSTGLVELESLRKVFEERFSGDTLAKNLQALERGYQEVTR
mgnify:FL=1